MRRAGLREVALTLPKFHTATDPERCILLSRASPREFGSLAIAGQKGDVMNNLTKYQPQFLGLLRIATALTFMEHGTQKLFKFPAMSAPAGGGSAPGGEMPAFMTSLMLIGGILETFGGLAIVLGLFTRPIAFILAGESAVIFWWMHVTVMGGGTIFPILNGGEAAVLYCFTFLYLVFAGPGAFALDNVVFRNRATAAA
jgi:putative oxidoreductase